jgi:hypothetical protein
MPSVASDTTTNVVSDLPLLIVCVAYACAVVVLQLYRVVPPRDWLVERLGHLKERILAENWRGGIPDDFDQKATELKKAWWRVPTSRVQAGWRYVHGREDQHILELPSYLVDEQLRSAKAQLEGSSNAETKSVIERIDEVLKANDLDDKRATLQRTMILRHSKSDTGYEDLAALLAKAVWLTILTLAIVAAMGVLFDREAYFLFGAAGALISRLTQVLRRMPSASDYGAAWSSLIMSAPAGALAGWLGVMIVATLANDPFNVFADSFTAPWDDALSLLGFFVAFVSGFSERWFNRLAETAESGLSTLLPKGKDAASEA